LKSDQESSLPFQSLRVPASSANLGPGFDALGLALPLYLECRFRLAPGLVIHASGCDSDRIPVDASNLIWQTALTVAEHARKPLPPIELEIRNEIPLGKGLGSSAAALTAGVVIASRLLDLDWSRARILNEAARLEGHPDNVAACALGGIVASAIDAEGHASAIRLDLPAACGLAVIIPDFVLPTSHSRSVLPATYTREEVIFNLQRVGLLVAALATGDLQALSVALADRLHQPFRAPLVPGLEEVLGLRLPGLLGCVLSGAGPSVLVFFEKGHESICTRVAALIESRGPRVQTMITSVAPHGLEWLD
jgi:homoserine kinase